MAPTDDLAVYRGFAAYCFGEAVCWPSHATVARDLGVSRPTITRAVHRLIKAGHMKLVARRWSPRTRKMHNVYELHAGFAIGPWVADMIVARSRFGAWKQRYAAKYATVNRNRRFCTARRAEPAVERDRTASLGLRAPP